MPQKTKPGHAEILQIHELAEEGDKTPADIARIVERPLKLVERILYEDDKPEVKPKAGGNGALPLDGRRVVTAKERRIRELAGQGVPLDEVARTVKVSMDKVLKTVHDGGRLVDPQPETKHDHEGKDGMKMSRKREPLTQEEEDRIVRLSNEGESAAEIAERVGRSPAVVYRVRRKHGLSKSYKRKKQGRKKAQRPKPEPTKLVSLGPRQVADDGPAEDLLKAARLIDEFSSLPEPLQEYVRHAVAGGA